jgi:PAS domain S-box-containing protein
MSPRDEDGPPDRTFSEPGPPSFSPYDAEFLEQVFQAAAEGMRVIDRRRVVVRANEPFARLAGLPVDRIVGRKCFEVFPGPLCNTTACPLTRILDGDEERLEWDEVKRRTDGTPIPCLITATPYRLASGETAGVIESFRDISARKGMESALRENEAFLQRVLDSLPASLVVVDDEGMIRVVNSAWRDFAVDNGVQDMDRVGVGANYLDICDAAEGPSSQGAAAAARGIRRLLAGERDFFELEYPCHGPGVQRWYRLTATPLASSEEGRAGAVVAHHDITSRRLAEEGANRFRAALDVSPDAVFLIDRESMLFVDVNRTACDQLGYSREELLAMGPAAVKPLLGETELREVFDRVLARGAGTIETVHRRKDGLDFPVEIMLGGLSEEEMDLVAAVVRDVSERKRMEEELVQARVHAEAANRAKSAFLASMSHEVRTPLNAVLGMVEMALSTDLDEAQQDYLETARDSAGHLLELLNDVLELSRIEAGEAEAEPADFDLYDLLAPLVRTMSAQAAAKGLDMELDLQPDTPRTVRGDAGQLRQVLANLLSNAVKFTAAGRVKLAVWPTQIDDGGEAVAFEVSDTGEGIPEDKASAVFEAFQQVDGSTTRAHGGTGLGLAICRQVVELMGGRISLESEPGSGSVFTVVLPLHPGSEAPRPPPPAPPEALSPRPGLRVLLVEDNPLIVMVADAFLERMGLQRQAVGAGREALDLLACDSFDAVLMDVELPGMDGLDCTRRLRAGEAGGLNQDVPVVAMTGHALPGLRRRCLNAGMDDYISKPVDYSELAAILERVTRERAPAERPRGPDTELFDRSKVLDRFDGDEGLLREVLDTFLEDAPLKLSALESAAAEQDGSRLEELAHALKGNAMTMGSPRCAERCQEVEAAARDGDPSRISRALDALRQDMDKLMALMERGGG